MKIATAILFFNKPALTARCVAGVRASIASANDRGARHRLLAVDNGSREATVFDGPSIEIIRLASNAGFTGGMNAALRAAFSNGETTLVALFSNDAIPADGFHQYLSDIAEDGPAIYCPHTYFFMDRTKPSYTHGTVDLETFELSHAFAPIGRPIEFPAYYPAAVTVWNRGAFEKLGGFNEEFFCYWEDVDLSYRCARFGVALISKPELKIFHLGRGTTGGNKSYAEHFARGRELVRKAVASDALLSRVQAL